MRSKTELDKARRKTRQRMLVRIVDQGSHLMTVNDGICEVDLPVREVRVIEEIPGRGGQVWHSIEVPGWLARKKELV